MVIKSGKYILVKEGASLWPDYYISTAKSNGLVLEDEFEDYNKKITRNEIARITARYINVNNIEKGKNIFDDLVENLKHNRIYNYNFRDSSSVKIYANEKNINKKMNSDKALLCLKEDILLSNKYLANNEDNYIAGALVIKCKDKISILVSGYDKNIVPEYLKYYLVWYINSKSNSLGHGGGMLNLTLTEIKNIQIKLPDNFQIQHKIVNEIDAILNTLNSINF